MPETAPASDRVEVHHLQTESFIGRHRPHWGKPFTYKEQIERDKIQGIDIHSHPMDLNILIKFR